MKIVQIKNNGTMVEIDKPFSQRNIRKIMREISAVKKIQYLYEWSYDDSIVQCYGCLQGKAGNENKHDLPPSGKKQVDLIDNSDTQLLFNDLFLVKVKNKQYLDLDIADYGLFYNLCFMGFDSCTDDDTYSIDEDAGSINDFIENDENDIVDGDDVIDDGNVDDGNVDDDDDDEDELDDDELDEDISEY